MKDSLLYKRCSKLERENQELKDTVQDKIECIVAYDEIIKHRDKEIKRLNNIIDELEKESYLGMLENQNNNEYAKGLYTAYKYINDKLQELKGADKE